MNAYNIFKSGPKKGQPKTLTDRVVRYLVDGLGMTERQPRGKYRWFTRTDLGNYYVGKAGAVRTGRCSTESRSISNHVHLNMTVWEQANGQDQ